MRHESFEAQLHDQLDRRARPDECDELRALAELSPADRDVLAAQQCLFEGLEADEIPELPASFAQRVVAQHLASASDVTVAARAPTRSRWVWELAIVAAFALLVVSAASYLLPPTESGAVVAEIPAAPASASQVAAAPEDQFAEQPAPTIDDAVVQHAAASNENPNTDAATPSDRPAVAESTPHNQRYDELYQAILKQLPQRTGDEDLLDLRPQWVDEMALGLRPVAASFGGAINTLRSTLPPSNKADRPEKPQAGLLELAPQSSLV